MLKHNRGLLALVGQVLVGGLCWVGGSKTEADRFGGCTAAPRHNTPALSPPQHLVKNKDMGTINQLDNKKV